MSYLQSSDIRQLFPRKLALHMRERKKKVPKSMRTSRGKVEKAGDQRSERIKAWRPRMAKN